VKVDCRGFHDRLADWLEGRLEATERDALERHVEGCAPCRDIAERFGEPPADLDTATPGRPDDLTHAILEQTSGRPCSHAEEGLGDWVDGSLAGTDAELMRMHLDGCVECSALASSMARLSRELPALAELEPDARFVPDVMASTMRRPRRVARALEAMRESWTRMLQRPRFALEGAYVASIVIVLMFGLPGSPLSGLPQKALDMVSRNPVTPLKEPVAELEARVSLGVATAWEVTSLKVRDTSFGIVQGVATYSSAAYENIREDFGTLLGREPSEPVTDAESGTDARSSQEPTETMEKDDER
jgi:predicted anti-sigma-YlaC factor YlaD